MIKIVNNEVHFDDGEISLSHCCGVYVLFKMIVFSLDNGSYMVEKCANEEDVANKWDYVCKKLKSNPNFLNVTGMNVLARISQVHSIERVYDKHDKSFGVMLNYSNQKIGIWNRSKTIIDKCYDDLEKVIIFGIAKDENNEKEQ